MYLFRVKKKTNSKRVNFVLAQLTKPCWQPSKNVVMEMLENKKILEVEEEIFHIKNNGINYFVMYFTNWLYIIIFSYIDFHYNQQFSSPSFFLPVSKLLLVALKGIIYNKLNKRNFVHSFFHQKKIKIKVLKKSYLI